MVDFQINLTQKQKRTHDLTGFYLLGKVLCFERKLEVNGCEKAELLLFRKHTFINKMYKYQMTI